MLSFTFLLGMSFALFFAFAVHCGVCLKSQKHSPKSNFIILEGNSDGSCEAVNENDILRKTNLSFLIIEGSLHIRDSEHSSDWRWEKGLSHYSISTYAIPLPYYPASETEKSPYVGRVLQKVYSRTLKEWVREGVTDNRVFYIFDLTSNLGPNSYNLAKAISDFKEIHKARGKSLVDELKYVDELIDDLYRFSIAREGQEMAPNGITAIIVTADPPKLDFVYSETTSVELTQMGVGFRILFGVDDENIKMTFTNAPSSTFTDFSGKATDVSGTFEILVDKEFLFLGYLDTTISRAYISYGGGPQYFGSLLSAIELNKFISRPYGVISRRPDPFVPYSTFALNMEIKDPVHIRKYVKIVEKRNGSYTFLSDGTRGLSRLTNFVISLDRKSTGKKELQMYSKSKTNEWRFKRGVEEKVISTNQAEPTKLDRGESFYVGKVYSRTKDSSVYYIFYMTSGNAHDRIAERAVQDFLLVASAINPKPEIIDDLYLFSAARRGAKMTTDGITAIVVKESGETVELEFTYGQEGSLWVGRAEVNIKDQTTSIKIIPDQFYSEDLASWEPIVDNSQYKLRNSNGKFVNITSDGVEASAIHKFIGCLEKFDEQGSLVTRAFIFHKAELIDIMKVYQSIKAKIPKGTTSLPEFRINPESLKLEVPRSSAQGSGSA